MYTSNLLEQTFDFQRLINHVEEEALAKQSLTCASVAMHGVCRLVHHPLHAPAITLHVQDERVMS